MCLLVVLHSSGTSTAAPALGVEMVVRWASHALLTVPNGGSHGAGFALLGSWVVIREVSRAGTSECSFVPNMGGLA